MQAPLRQRLAREMLVFIDGRAELYGEQFVLKYFRALQLRDVNLLLAFSGTTTSMPCC